MGKKKMEVTKPVQKEEPKQTKGMSKQFVLDLIKRLPPKNTFPNTVKNKQNQRNQFFSRVRRGI